MKQVIPPHLMLATCKECTSGCQDCDKSDQRCYKCKSGFILDQAMGMCNPDPLWNQTKSEIKVSVSKQAISRCESVKIGVDPIAGFDSINGLQDIRWNILVSGQVEISDEISSNLEKLIRSTQG